MPVLQAVTGAIYLLCLAWQDIMLPFVWIRDGKEFSAYCDEVWWYKSQG